jgi:hypothetical protein
MSASIMSFVVAAVLTAALGFPARKIRGSAV